MVTVPSTELLVSIVVVAVTLAVGSWMAYRGREAHHTKAVEIPAPTAQAACEGVPLTMLCSVACVACVACVALLVWRDRRIASPVTVRRYPVDFRRDDGLLPERGATCGC